MEPPSPDLLLPGEVAADDFGFGSLFRTQTPNRKPFPSERRVLRTPWEGCEGGRRRSKRKTPNRNPLAGNSYSHTCFMVFVGFYKSLHVLHVFPKCLPCLAGFQGFLGASTFSWRGFRFFVSVLSMFWFSIVFQCWAPDMLHHSALGHPQCRVGPSAGVLRLVCVCLGCVCGMCCAWPRCACPNHILGKHVRWVLLVRS